jgi:hypothetical protein
VGPPVLAPARALDKLRFKLGRPPRTPVNVGASGQVRGSGVLGRALMLAAGRT